MQITSRQNQIIEILRQISGVHDEDVVIDFLSQLRIGLLKDPDCMAQPIIDAYTALASKLASVKPRAQTQIAETFSEFIDRNREWCGPAAQFFHEASLIPDDTFIEPLAKIALVPITITMDPVWLMMDIAQRAGGRAQGLAASMLVQILCRRKDITPPLSTRIEKYIFNLLGGNNAELRHDVACCAEEIDCTAPRNRTLCLDILSTVFNDADPLIRRGAILSAKKISTRYDAVLLPQEKSRIRRMAEHCATKDPDPKNRRAADAFLQGARHDEILNSWGSNCPPIAMVAARLQEDVQAMLRRDGGEALAPIPKSEPDPVAARVAELLQRFAQR